MELEQEELYEVLEKFLDFINKFSDEFKKDCEKSIDDIKYLKQKYPHSIRSSKILKKKIKDKKFNEIHPPYIYELLNYYDTHNEFNQHEKEIIYKYYCNKITSIFKHAQAQKTAICNIKIIDGFLKPSTLSICIAKNNLEAMPQWIERLLMELKDRFPTIKLEDQIMVISSKKNTLRGNATHCKNVDSAIVNLVTSNSIKIIFVCSNKSRITDVLNLCKSFNHLKDSSRKNIQILHDEAHNDKEGIPPYRDFIEHIILQPNILAYIPVSASPDPIYDDKNNLWLKENLENKVINYTEFSDIKSDDPDYSSCANAEPICFESLHNFKNHKINKLDEETYREAYDTVLAPIDTYTEDDCLNYLSKAIDNFEAYKIISENELLTPKIHKNLIENEKLFHTYSIDQVRNLIKLYTIEKGITLNYCCFMENYKEIEAVNNGLNFLDLNSSGRYIFIPDEFNLHIISTPCRTIITRYLAKEAIKKDYKPIVLAIYGSKYHLFYDGNEIIIDPTSTIMKSGQFNDKLYNLIEHLKSKNININRPFIIIGNYSPTGESITFVNYNYGTVRANCRLISTDASSDYQEGARSNYITKKFKENDKDWKSPIKYLVGPESYIRNCLAIEKENDERIDMLKNRSDDTSETDTHVFNNITSNKNANTLQCSIPVKITINDRDHIEVQKLIAIINKPRKSKEDKENFLNILLKCAEDPYIDVTLDDKTGKLSNEGFTIKDFRTYRKKEKITKSSWKFKNYDANYNINMSFINDTQNIGKHECDLLTCLDDYLEEFINFKKTWWLSYKY